MLTPALVSAFLLQSGPANASAAPALTDHLRNGSFEAGRTGWQAGTARTTFRVVRTASNRVAQLTTNLPTASVMVKNQGAVRASAKGQLFVASAWVRSSQRGQTGRLTISESKAHSAARLTARSVHLTRSWRLVSVTATAASAESVVGVRVNASSLHRGQRFEVDRVRLRAQAVTSGSAPAAASAPASAPHPASAAPAPLTSAPAPVPASAPAAPLSLGTRFGASPTNGAASSSVVSKFGVGASVRIFSQDIAAPTHPVGASTVHTSFALLNYGVSRDQALRQVAAGTYDAQIRAAAVGTPAGDSIEIVHEADKKITDGGTTWPVVLAAKNHFYDVAKAANPNVLIANTVTGWTAEPTSGRNFAQWGQVKADILGIDCDGINPATGAYPNYDAEIAAAAAFVRTNAASGYRSWAVPEFTAGRQASDTTGAKRVAWFQDLAAKFAGNGALYVDYFDYNNTPNEALELPAEIGAWKTFVS